MKDKKLTTYQMAVTAVMAAVLCVLGPLTVPIGAVPISLANFVICLTAWLLGPKFGTLSVVIYLALGAIGIPVFSGYGAGLAKLAGPTGGYLVGYLLLAFIGLTCSLTAQYFSAKAAVGYSTALRHALFAHIQSLSFSEMDTLGTSTLITRMTSDINQVQSGLNLFLRLFLRSPFVVLGAMVMAFTVNARAAMIFVVTIPLLSVVVFGVMVVTRPLYKTVQTRLTINAPFAGSQGEISMRSMNV